MSDGKNPRWASASARRSRPMVEGLEERALLSTAANGVSALATAPVKEFDYTTPQGTHVAIHLYGSGTLYDNVNHVGTNVDAHGMLDLEFSGTNEQTGIIATIHGGDGHPQLRMLKHIGLPAESLSGIGSSLVNVIKLKNFDLVDGGRINLTGGIHVLDLNSVGANTRVSLREIPPTLLNGTSTAGSTENGVTLGFLLDVSGARTLTNATGTFVAGFNLIPTNAVSTTNPNSIVKNPGAPPAPPGVVLSVNHVNGPSRAQQGIGNPRIFGYDPLTNTLTRFDVGTDVNGNITGKPSLTILNALPGGGKPEAGASLGRNHGNLVVMVNDGSNVYAYDPITGAPVGHFSLSGLTTVPAGSPPGTLPTFDPLNPPNRIGAFDSFTVVGNATGGANGLGRLVAIDVTNSLATGVAALAKNTTPYDSTRGFGFSGGFAGIPGTSTLYTAGGAFFDPYQPNSTQLGVASLSPGATAGIASFRESARNAFTGTTGATLNSGSHGQVGTNPSDAFANIDLGLALVTAADPVAQTDTVTLYNSQTFAKTTTATLNNTPNRLTAITGSFRPDLAGTALLDINGNTQSFRAQDARGLVFNGLGNVNLVKIHRATDSTIIGYPLAHAEIPLRTNVLIVSTTRTPGTRNGVTVIPNLRPTGPLSQP